MKNNYKEMIDVQFEKLKSRKDLKEFSILLSTLKNVSFSDKEFFVSQFLWAPILDLNPLSLVSDLVVLMNLIRNKEASIYEVSMFFIKLNCLIDELIPQLSKKVTTEVERTTKIDLTRSNHIKDKIIAQVNSIKEELTEVEYELIKFIRNKNSHLNTSRYMINLKKNGEIIRNYGNSGKSRHKVMFDILIYWKKFNCDELKFAHALRPRTHETVRTIKALLKELSDEEANIV